MTARGIGVEEYLSNSAYERFEYIDGVVRELNIGAEQRQARYLEGAPDLAVEICSPGDTMSEAVRKMQDWLAAGPRLGWLTLPEEQALWIFRPGEPQQFLNAGDRANGGTLLPGLEFAVAGLFQA